MIFLGMPIACETEIVPAFKSPVLYIFLAASPETNELKPLGVLTTRIAMGIPVGSDLDWSKEVTMSKALEGRREY
jgi:hypothetical protein